MNPITLALGLLTGCADKEPLQETKDKLEQAISEIPQKLTDAHCVLATYDQSFLPRIFCRNDTTNVYSLFMTPSCQSTDNCSDTVAFEINCPNAALNFIGDYNYSGVWYANVPQELRGAKTNADIVIIGSAGIATQILKTACTDLTLDDDAGQEEFTLHL